VEALSQELLGQPLPPVSHQSRGDVCVESDDRLIGREASGETVPAGSAHLRPLALIRASSLSAQDSPLSILAIKSVRRFSCC